MVLGGGVKDSSRDVEGVVYHLRVTLARLKQQTCDTHTNTLEKRLQHKQKTNKVKLFGLNENIY